LYNYFITLLDNYPSRIYIIFLFSLFFLSIVLINKKKMSQKLT